MKNKIDAVRAWYRNGGDEVWGNVKITRYKLHHISQIETQLLTGTAKQHHIDWINRCYHYYYTISPKVIERRKEWAKRQELYEANIEKVNI